MSPTLIIETEDKKYNYQQSKTGKVIDINKMYDELVSTAALNSSLFGTGTITVTGNSGGWSTFASDDIPF